jgi:P27 family predicted phage terminase small subunit
MPSVPEHLTDDAKVEWGRVCNELYEAGLLSKIDRAILACYCQAYGAWIEADRILADFAAKAKEKHDPGRGYLIMTINGNVIQNPAVGVRNKAMADVAKYATDLGMTPSARSRVTAKPPIEADSDPAAKYLSRA